MPEGQVEVKLPNHMTVEELVNSGKSLPQAKHIMAKRVFGDDHKTDEKGNPVEQGIGSEANPFKATHLAALEKAAAAKVAGSGASPELIAAVVAAVVTAMKEKEEL